MIQPDKEKQFLLFQKIHEILKSEDPRFIDLLTVLQTFLCACADELEENNTSSAALEEILLNPVRKYIYQKFGDPLP